MVAQVTFTIMDSKGKIGFNTYWLDESDATWIVYGPDKLASILEYWTEVARRLDPLIMGVILNCSVSFKVPLPATIKTVPEPDADIEEKARLVFPPYAPYNFLEGYACEIPSFDHAVFGSGTKVTELDDDGVNDFVRLLYISTDTDGWAAEYGGICDNRGNSVGLAMPTLIKTFKK